MSRLSELSIVVLSYERREALAQTLERLGPLREAGAEVIVVDNASRDGSAEMVRERFGWARLVVLEENVAIAGFNRGAELAGREYLLILDDDSWPQAGAVERALEVMAADERLGGLMLHRRHPRSGEWEWPGEAVAAPQRNWPDMGCGNLLRTASWRRVGGYEEGFFLYRNDTDLALKLLASGEDVAFDPSLVVLHDSPIVRRKTARWFALSTRNWVWMCRRHGRGAVLPAGVLLGWAWAHRLARLSPSRHAGVVRGVWSGVRCSPPPLPPGVRADGRALRRLLGLKVRLRGAAGAGTEAGGAPRGRTAARGRA